MIKYCNKPELLIQSSCIIRTVVRKRIPSDSEMDIMSKKKYPYINKKDIIFNIDYLGQQYTFTIPKGFCWNGTNCLFLQHCPTLLDASMIHDYICNHHNIIGYDRQLSSIIFREMGIFSGMPKWFMYIAYVAVDWFQKYFGRDLNGDKWKNEF